MILGADGEPLLLDAGQRGELSLLDRQHMLAARHDPNAFLTYVMRDQETGLPILQSPWHMEWQALASAHRRMLLWSHTESGKALPLDTPIPVPGGFKPMGELVTGDAVFDSAGRACRVTAAHDVLHGRQLYELELSDGDKIVTDADHQWIAWSIDDRHAKRAPRVVTTRTMAAKLRRGAQWMWTLPVAKPVQHPSRDLPVPPYVLGAWLGDGTSANSQITFHEDDVFVYEQCKALVGANPPVRHKKRPHVMKACLGPSRSGTRVVTGLRGQLRELGVLNDKHVPLSYRTASIEQRAELLMGLLDTDGSVSNASGSRVELTLMNERLAHDAAELVRSLGFKASIRSAPAKIRGRCVGTRWRVAFTARTPVFKLPRKLAMQRLTPGSTATGKRTVVVVRPAPTQPVRCIEVDSPDRSYLATRSYTVTHNSTQLTGRALYELGRNPQLRVCVLSNTVDQATARTTLMGQYIERSAELRRVFPKLKPHPSLPWAQQKMFVQRPFQANDPSIRALGVHGSILGGRIDLLIVDDILDFENTRTPGQRNDLEAWFRTTMEGRLTANARIWWIGNAWHVDDVMHRYAALPNWKAFRYPVVDASGRTVWPANWPQARVDEKRDDLGPVEFARQMMCKARSDADARFKEEWINLAKRLGEGVRPAWALASVPAGCAVYTGVDLGIRTVKKKGSGKPDLTVLFTICVHPNGSREVLDCTSGRWSGPDILKQIEDVHRRYHGIVYVENNAAQDYILQFMRAGSAVPVKAFNTGTNKYHPEFGIEGMATEMANGKWIIPCTQGVTAPELAEWINELLYYDPAAHPGDRLMASWFASMGARLGVKRPTKVHRRRVDLLSR